LTNKFCATCVESSCRLFACPTPILPHFFVIFVLQTDQKTGLSDALVESRFAQYGYNELPEKKVNPLLMFLAYFWGPMPIMIWAAAIIELGQSAAGLGGWDDFTVLMLLQFAERDRRIHRGAQRWRRHPGETVRRPP